MVKRCGALRPGLARMRWYVRRVDDELTSESKVNVVSPPSVTYVQSKLDSLGFPGSSFVIRCGIPYCCTVRTSAG
jgi:hypothetical protein